MRVPNTPPGLPHDPLFDSAWLKWGRATVHAQALHADLDTFGPNGGPEPTFSLRTEYQSKRHGFAVIVQDVDPMPPTWGLLLGDVANNLRSALDQLAWALVSRGATPPALLTDEQQRGVYFPICKSASHFRNVKDRMLPGVKRADIAKVRRYQPYKYPSRGRWFARSLSSRLRRLVVEFSERSPLLAC